LASEFIRDQLESFYGQFSEWFNLAQFPDLEQQLQKSELAVFAKAAGGTDSSGPRSAGNYDCFSGLRAVIRERLLERSLEQIKLAAELFNWTIEFGLACCDNDARAVIKIGSAGDVAPVLLDRILSRLPLDPNRRGAASPSSGVEQRFLPVVPVLTILKDNVESIDWVQNQLALGIFFWIAEMYKVEIETDCG
jgi:hypothetical protein